jgi:creatinine amidohydrolase/Fe(II)-dependent formamide hydrolase-like protein
VNDIYNYTALHGADIMKKLSLTLLAIAMISTAICAQTARASRPSVSGPSPVDFEYMTWPEVRKALDSGKTTVLIYNGGTEQRGPQAINGGHTLIARALGREIAERLGNAILAPVLPFSVNNANAELPGTIGLPGPLFAAVNEQVAEQMIVNGFRNVVLMGDHGGGQQELAEVAKKLDARYAPKGIHVVFCGDVYKKTTDDFNKWLVDNGYPAGTHAYIMDTSELLYLGGDQGWVRKELIATAVGGPRANNGISGDARRSTPEIGRRATEMKVDYAVKQIRQLLHEKATAAAR